MSNQEAPEPKDPLLAKIEAVERGIRGAAGAEKTAAKLGKLGKAIETLAADLLPKIGALEGQAFGFLDRISNLEQGAALEKSLLPAALENLENDWNKRHSDLARQWDGRHAELKSQITAIVEPLTGYVNPPTATIRLAAQTAAERLADLHEMHESLDSHPAGLQQSTMDFDTLRRRLHQLRERTGAEIRFLRDRFNALVEPMVGCSGPGPDRIRDAIKEATERESRYENTTADLEARLAVLEECYDSPAAFSSTPPDAPAAGIPPEKSAQIMARMKAMGTREGQHQADLQMAIFLGTLKRLLHAALVGVGLLTPFAPTGATALDEIQNPLKEALDLVKGKESGGPAEPGA